MSRLFLTIMIDNKHFVWTVIALKNDDRRALALIDCESTSLFIIYMSLVKEYSANGSAVPLQSISHKINISKKSQSFLYQRHSSDR